MPDTRDFRGATAVPSSWPNCGRLSLYLRLCAVVGREHDPADNGDCGVDGAFVVSKNMGYSKFNVDTIALLGYY